jgi:hypothetical protein
MLAKKTAFVTVLALCSLSSSAAFACNESEGCISNARLIKTQLRENAERRAEESSRASLENMAIAIAAGEIVRFEVSVAAFDSLATAYDSAANRYFALRGRYFQRVRYELGSYMDRLITAGNQLDEDMMNSYSLNSEIIERSRELIKRARANGTERGKFHDYWNAETQATLEAGLAGLKLGIQGDEKQFGFEQIVQGVENDDIGRAMLGLPTAAELAAQEEARAAKARKHRRH